jgi:hypothetical protein
MLGLVELTYRSKREPLFWRNPQVSSFWRSQNLRICLFLFVILAQPESPYLPVAPLHLQEDRSKPYRMNILAATSMQ